MKRYPPGIRAGTEPIGQPLPGLREFPRIRAIHPHVVHLPLPGPQHLHQHPVPTQQQRR